MPRNGSGVMSKPAGTTASPNTTIESSKFNSVIDDIITDLNTPRPIVAGGTGGGTQAAAQAALGVAPRTIGSFYATYGGTADAITLTTGMSLSALTTGQEFRFRASATNTGAMTANVDGIGAVTVKTVTGADTPAGYIRTDVDTIGRYDGTNLVASRAVESGSGANGIWTRYEDGTQTCALDNLTLTYTTGIRLTATWTFPAAFSATSYAVTASLRPELDAGLITDINAGFTGAMATVGTLAHASRTTTTAVFGLFSVTSAFVSGDKAYVSVTAIGKWY